MKIFHSRYWKYQLMNNKISFFWNLLNIVCCQYVIPWLPCYQHYGYTITIFIEYVAHLCDNSFDSWTPSGVPYFQRPNLPDLNLELVPSWIQDGSSFTQKAYVISTKKYAFRPELNLELFQVQIRTDLYKFQFYEKYLH